MIVVHFFMQARFVICINSQKYKICCGLFRENTVALDIAGFGRNPACFAVNNTIAWH